MHCAATEPRDLLGGVRRPQVDEIVELPGGELDLRASGKERRYAWDYDETFELYAKDLPTGNSVNLTSNSTVELNQWHHVVATVEGSTARIYIDGALDRQTTRNGVAIAARGEIEMKSGSRFLIGDKMFRVDIS